MKVTDIKVDILGMDFRNALIVRVETDAGITGWAETVMKRWSQSIADSILAVKSYLLGKDPTAIENHWEKIYRDSFWVGGPVHSAGLSAIDCALWEILAQAHGLPVYKLLGGPTRNTVPVYCHCPAAASPEAFAENVKRCKQQGYRAIKTTLPLFYGAEGSGRRPVAGIQGRMVRLPAVTGKRSTLNRPSGPGLQNSLLPHGMPRGRKWGWRWTAMGD